MKADIRWLDDPQVFRVNRLDAHSDHKFYENKEDYEKKEQRLKQSLNGIWKFRYSENAMERPADFYQKWFQCRSFDEMKVPQHIELAGYDKIHYINTMYPWEGHIYRRPAETGKEKGKGMFSQAEYNPVGSYIRKFDLQDGLKGKRIILSFEGVEQAFYVWVNGEFVGYAEDSFTVSEFDITSYVKEKDNLLAVEVHKRSTAAFLEDQDFFRFFWNFPGCKSVWNSGSSYRRSVDTSNLSSGGRKGRNRTGYPFVTKKERKKYPGKNKSFAERQCSRDKDSITG